MKFSRSSAPTACGAMAVTLIVVVTAMALTGIFPFGDHVMLYDDAAIQYVGFFGWYSSVLHGDANLFYSFSKSLGGSTFSLFAYYLASPLSLLCYFFSFDNMPELFSVLVPLKISLAGLSCSIYLSKRFDLFGIANIVLSCCYSLAACNLEAGSNIMWLEGVIFLPIICLAVYDFIHSDKVIPVCLSVGLLILFNWYAGYMASLAACGCFFIEAYLAKLGLHAFVKKGLLFACCMFIAIGLSMPFFLPVIVDMLNSASVSDSGFLYTLETFSIWPDGLIEGIGSLFMGSSNFSEEYFTQWAIRPGNFPVSGVLLVLASFGFFAYKGEKRNYRYLFLVVLAFFLTSFFFKPLDMIWTGFTRADSYSPRYYHVFVFCLVSFSACSLKYSLEMGEAERRRSLLLGITVYLAGVFMLVLAGWRVASLKALILQIFIACFTALLLTISTEKRLSTRGREGRTALIKSACVAGALLLCFCSEGVYMQSHQMKLHYGDTSYESFSAYAKELSGLSATISGSRFENFSNDSRGFLLRQDNLAPTGENLALGLMGLSHYSSSGEQAVNELLGNLGYCKTPGTRGIVYCNSPIYLTDSFFAVNDIVCSSDCSPYGYVKAVSLIDDPSGTERAYYHRSGENLTLVSKIKGDPFSFSWSDNYFENQTLFFKGLSDEVGNLYTSCNLELVEENPDETVYVATTCGDGPVYLQVETNSPGRLYCDDIFKQTVGNWEFDTNLIYLGTCKLGDKIKITIHSDNPEDLANSAIDARTLDAEVASKVLGGLRRSFDLDVSEASGTLGFKVSSNSFDKYLISLPYDSNWRVLIDGEEVSVESYQGLLVVNVPAGEHDVLLSYGLPRALFVGLAISVMSVVALIILSFVLKKKGLRAQH